ncbi:Kv channel-interacting protein 4 [Halotydeus destructor]|nr:Kv channel-interacting protein 4 [Halotydeus destructor]
MITLWLSSQLSVELVVQDFAVLLRLPCYIKQEHSYAMASISTATYEKRHSSSIDTLFGDDLFVLPRYRPTDLNKLCKLYKFERHEIRLLYQGFKQECPNGVCTEELFKNLFSKLFPLGDATSYAHFVFKACKRYTVKDLLNFESFLSILNCISRGSLLDKITWMFNLYDTERRGRVTRKSLMTIHEAVRGILGPECSVATGNTSATPEEQMAAIFGEMDRDSNGFVTLQQFVDWYFMASVTTEPSADNLFMFHPYYIIHVGQEASGKHQVS